MKPKVLPREMLRIRGERNRLQLATLTLLGLLVASVLANCLQAYRATAVVLTPMVGDTIRIQGNSANRQAIEMYARFFLALSLNTTPHNIDAQHDALLKYVHPRVFKQVRAVLVEKELRAKENGLSTHFNIERFHFGKGYVDALGELQVEVSDKIQSKRAARYRIYLTLEGSKPMVHGFEEREVKNG